MNIFSSWVNPCLNPVDSARVVTNTNPAVEPKDQRRRDPEKIWVDEQEHFKWFPESQRSDDKDRECRVVERVTLGYGEQVSILCAWVG